MFIDNINYKNINSINLLDINTNTHKTNSNNFMNYIKTALGEISKVQNHAKIDTEKFTLNKSDISLNDIMINLQKSSISMQIAIQVRNKLVSSYQEIMNQQI